MFGFLPAAACASAANTTDANDRAVGIRTDLLDSVGVKCRERAWRDDDRERCQARLNPRSISAKRRIQFPPNRNRSSALRYSRELRRSVPIKTNGRCVTHTG